MESNSCRKNDRKDDKTMWELMPLDCLEDIARVYTEGAKKYGPNKWQGLENGYERYKGALLRHLYASESNEFDEETGCRHLAQVAWNAIAMLWLSKHKQKEEKKIPIEKIDNNLFSKGCYLDLSKIDLSSIVNNNTENSIKQNYKQKVGGFMDPEYKPEMIIKCKKK